MIAERYGYEPQSRQCIEEIAGLTQAISELWRKRNFGGNDRQIAEARNAVLDRMTDTLIMLWQMKYLPDFGERPPAKRIDEKLNKQLEWMGVTEE